MKTIYLVAVGIILLAQSFEVVAKDDDIYAKTSIEYCKDLRAESMNGYCEIICQKNTKASTYSLSISYDIEREGFKRIAHYKVFSKKKVAIVTNIYAPINLTEVHYRQEDGEPSFIYFQTAMKKAKRIAEVGKKIEKMTMYFMPLVQSTKNNIAIEYKTATQNINKRKMRCDFLIDVSEMESINHKSF